MSVFPADQIRILNYLPKVVHICKNCEKYGQLAHIEYHQNEIGSAKLELSEQ